MCDYELSDNVPVKISIGLRKTQNAENAQFMNLEPLPQNEIKSDIIHDQRWQEVTSANENTKISKFQEVSKKIIAEKLLAERKTIQPYLPINLITAIKNKRNYIESSDLFYKTSGT